VSVLDELGILPVEKREGSVRMCARPHPLGHDDDAVIAAASDIVTRPGLFRCPKSGSRSHLWEEIICRTALFDVQDLAFTGKIA